MMRIGITQRVVENDAYPERRDALAHDWHRYLARILPEAILLPVPNHPESVENWFSGSGIDGLILSGGEDWGETCERDRTEEVLLRCTKRKNIPVLGVCRGAQVVNLLMGGASSLLPSRSHVASDHEVELLGEPFLSLAGAGNILVNSYHQQGISVKDIAPGCRPFAVGEDGYVEGYCCDGHPALGVMWHPERRNSSEAFDRELARRLFLEGRFW